ncbi:MAG TPA: hypothetical protein VNQ79_18645 [Blastocatellia bacterium]|nr:hypothetical protein [Blastocatellia bacterium]
MRDERLKGGLFRGERAQPRLLAVRSGGERQDETREQIAVIEWARWSARLIERMCPLESLALTWLHHIPNGGLREKKQRTGRTGQLVEYCPAGQRLHAMGVTRGVFDLLLPWRTELYGGLWIEMKAGRNQLTPEQRQFNTAIFQLGYQTAVAWTWQEAARAVIRHLALDEKGARYAPVPD